MSSQNHKNPILTPPEIRLIHDIAGSDSVPFSALSNEQKAEFFRRQSLLHDGYPLDYLLSETEIAGMRFVIPNGVFIPRPETELILPKLRDFLKDKSPKQGRCLSSRRILKQVQDDGEYIMNFSKKILIDMCCGTGFLGVQLAADFDSVLSVDISLLALQTTQKNATLNSVSNLCTLHSDGFYSPKISSYIAHNSDWVLVCNPPYVPLSDVIHTAKNKIKFEPAEAIFSGKDGLDFFRQTLQFLATTRYPPQVCFFELDPRNVGQAEKLFRQNISECITEIWKDCDGRERFLVVNKA